MIQPHVVYHIASMGNWQEVVQEQMQLLRECDLREVVVTHVGVGIDYVMAVAKANDLHVRVANSDPNTDHYETFAMIEIDRLAKTVGTDRHILYMHSKGVSNPGSQGKVTWRRAMQEWVVRRWRDNVPHIDDDGGHDAIGFNWLESGQQHFSGNFWIARADWIRKLPNYVQYHHQNNLTRYACEKWIGAYQWCRAFSLGYSNYFPNDDGISFGFMPPGYDPSVYTKEKVHVEIKNISGQAEYHRLVMQQSPEAMPALAALLAELRPAKVLDVGTGAGGLTLFMRHTLNKIGLRSTSILSLDVAGRESYHWLRQAGIDVRVGEFFSPWVIVADPSVVDYFHGDGPILVLCDGGRNAKEFACLSQYLRVGDVIAAHDYAPNSDYFYTNVYGKTWNWLEFTDADAAGPSLEFGLTPYRDEEMRDAAWCCKKKTESAQNLRAVVDVSVCIPTIIDRRLELLRALESVARQSVRPEAVIVNWDYERVGSAANRNRTFEKATTEWLAFLDDDDVIYDDHLRLLLQTANETGADVVYSDGDVVTDGVVLGCIQLPFDPVKLREVNYISTTTLVRTRLAKAVGGFQCVPGTNMDDWGFWLALLDAGAKFAHLPVRTWRYNRWGDGRTSGNTAGSVR